MHLNRRDALVLGLGAAATALAPRLPAAEGFFARHKLPIGLQLYTVSEAAQKDLHGSFERIAKIGFKAIELAGYHGHTPAELRAAAEHFGLKFTGIHVGATARSPGEPALSADIGKLAAEMHLLGIKEVTLPMIALPEGAAPLQGESFPAFFARVIGGMGKDVWQRTAAFLNERAALLAKEGLGLSYHNHNIEFAPVAGTTGWDILFAETDPKQVFFEMDAGWVAAAGRDPIELLKRHAGRIRQMHVKDIRATTKTNFALQQDPTEVGSGKLPWAQMLPAAYDAGVRHFYVEQEPPYTMDRFDAIAKSFRHLSTLG
jgi:sugar phosphate isomerase/epimerase